MRFPRKAGANLLVVSFVIIASLIIGNYQLNAQRTGLSFYTFRSQNDSLLDFLKIDYGYNNGINFYADQTYERYKRKVRGNNSYPILKIRSKNSYLGVVFNFDHEVEKISYYSLDGGKMEKKVFHTRKIYRTQKYGFEIGDSLSFCLKKLAGNDFKIESNYNSNDTVDVKIHGLINEDNKSSSINDEYTCNYFFVNKRLYSIQMSYYRGKR